jgi:hypothetical protein
MHFQAEKMRYSRQRTALVEPRLYGFHIRKAVVRGKRIFLE